MRWLHPALRAVWRWLNGPTDHEEAPPTGDVPIPDGDGRIPDRGIGEPWDQYIERLLTAAGGRMRQQEILAARDWSPSTVSRHLSTMEAKGQIIRMTAGREKIIFLPSAAPASVNAPDEPARS